MRSLGWILWLGVAGAVAVSLGCATSFQGSARVSGGPRGCFDLCAAAHMRMAQYVYVGEYSTACVCELDPARMGGGSATTARAASSGATVAAAAGVAIQMADEQQRAAMRR